MAKTKWEDDILIEDEEMSTEDMDLDEDELYILEDEGHIDEDDVLSAFSNEDEEDSSYDPYEEDYYE